MCELDRYSSRANHQSSDLKITRSARVAGSSWWLSKAADISRHWFPNHRSCRRLVFIQKLLSMETSHLHCFKCGNPWSSVAGMSHARMNICMQLGRDSSRLKCYSNVSCSHCAACFSPLLCHESGRIQTNLEDLTKKNLACCSEEWQSCPTDPRNEWEIKPQSG